VQSTATSLETTIHCSAAAWAPWRVMRCRTKHSAFRCQIRALHDNSSSKIIRWSGSKFPTGDAWSYHQLNEYWAEGHAKFANSGLMCCYAYVNPRWLIEEILCYVMLYFAYRWFLKPRWSGVGGGGGAGAPAPPPVRAGQAAMDTHWPSASIYQYLHPHTSIPHIRVKLVAIAVEELHSHR
jgi:hypothetical protein